MIPQSFSWTNGEEMLVVGSGFEPLKAEPADLQSV